MNVLLEVSYEKQQPGEMRPPVIEATSARRTAYPMHDLDVPVYRFSVDDYARMSEVGILAPEDRTELLDGRIVEMARIGSRHAAVVNMLNRVLTTAVGERGIVTVQNPIRLDAYSEPVPDLIVARPRNDFYAEGHPEPEDVFLVIEVSDTTLLLDRGMKVSLYARTAIPEVWIVDLQHGRLETYRDPLNGQYRNLRTLEPPAHAEPAGIERVSVDLEWLLR